MSDLNTFTATGNLVDDPRLMGAENNVVRFSIAINNGFGERRTTTFLDCVGFGKQAATIEKFFNKGKPIGVQGTIVPNEWTDKDGNVRKKLELRLNVIDGFFFLGRGNGSSEASAEEPVATQGAGEANVSASASTELF